MGRRFRNDGRLTDGQVGFLLCVPGIAIFSLIILYPFINAIVMSFTDRSLLFPGFEWVGAENYIKLFKDPYFLKTIGVTVLFVASLTGPAVPLRVMTA